MSNLVGQLKFLMVLSPLLFSFYYSFYFIQHTYSFYFILLKVRVQSCGGRQHRLPGMFLHGSATPHWCGLALALSIVLSKGRVWDVKVECSLCSFRVYLVLFWFVFCVTLSMYMLVHLKYYGGFRNV